MINPIAKKRFEEQKNTYIAEERKLQELGAKRKSEEKEREDFISGLGLKSAKETAAGKKHPAAALEEGSFFKAVKDFAGIGDKKDENWNKDFQKGLLEENQKEEKQKYLSPYMQVKQNTSDKIYGTYKAGEEWLMSEGEDDFAKGLINNSRSSVGVTVEDIAYAMKDFAQWYKPAEKVLSERTAGKIRDKAEQQFENAKGKTGDFGDKIIDFGDESSKALGYYVFGAKAGNYLQEIGEGFDRYRSLREQGYSKEEALRESSKDLAMMIASSKIDDKLLKNNKIDERLFGKNGVVDKVDDDAYNRANNIGELANEYHDLLTKAEWAKYYKDIADSGKLNKPLGYEFVSYQDGIILYSKKVRTSGTANDYQIIDYWFADTDNVYDEVKKLQSTIDKSGGHYGERKIRQKLDEISGYYD